MSASKAVFPVILEAQQLALGWVEPQDVLPVLPILHIEKPGSEMSRDLSRLTQLATDWPGTPSLEF